MPITPITGRYYTKKGVIRIYFLGIDIGSSKTLAACADEKGLIKSTGRAGGGNFQTVGHSKARENISQSINRCLQNAEVHSDEIKASYVGAAGADRPTDFKITEQVLQGIIPGRVWDFENDAVLGLLAEAKEKRGVSVVCGTGTNVIAFDRYENRVQIGGLGYLFGDYAGGPFITRQAIRRAVRGKEGRGPDTILYDMLCEAFGIDKLIDLMDFIYEDNLPDLGNYTELVIKGARKGDKVAKNILTDVAAEMALAVRAALNRLDENKGLPIVAIGGVFQKDPHKLLFEYFKEEIQKRVPGNRVRLLTCTPVIGAVIGAMLKTNEEIKDDVYDRLQSSYDQLNKK